MSFISGHNKTGKTEIAILKTFFFKRLYIRSEDNSAKIFVCQISKHTQLTQAFPKKVLGVRDYN